MATKFDPTAPESTRPEPRNHHAEVVEEVRGTAMALYAARLRPRLFELSVVALESTKARRLGLRLTVAPLADGGSRFLLTIESTGETCATLDFNPFSDQLEFQDLAPPRAAR